MVEARSGVRERPQVVDAAALDDRAALRFFSFEAMGQPPLGPGRVVVPGEPCVDGVPLQHIKASGRRAREVGASRAGQASPPASGVRDSSFSSSCFTASGERV
ncbi:hypothetical protein GCM10027359_22160 [Marilutibacter aestuarii]